MKISGKGQIVIPITYRQRLIWHPGMEVNFRIRGHTLIVELDTDVQKDVKYLEDKKGKLGEDEIEESMYSEIIYELLSQQFYNGEDRVTDRVGRQELKIRGANSIIQEAVKVLIDATNHWIKGEYTETLREFADVFDLDFPTLIGRYCDKIRNMEIGEEDMIAMMGGEVMYAMALGETLSQFRTRVGDIVTEKLIKEAEERGYIEKLGEEAVEDEVTKSLADDYSILMNLRVLRELARVGLRSIGQRDWKTISKKMLDDYRTLETPQDVIKRRIRAEKRAEKKMRGSKTPIIKVVNANRKSEESSEQDTKQNTNKKTDDNQETENGSDTFELPKMPDFEF